MTATLEDLERRLMAAQATSHFVCLKCFATQDDVIQKGCPRWNENKCCPGRARIAGLKDGPMVGDAPVTSPAVMDEAGPGGPLTERGGK